MKTSEVSTSKIRRSWQITPKELAYGDRGWTWTTKVVPRDYRGEIPD
jgi:hypothetical protein